MSGDEIGRTGRKQDASTDAGIGDGGAAVRHNDRGTDRSRKCGKPLFRRAKRGVFQGCDRSCETIDVGADRYDSPFSVVQMMERLKRVRGDRTAKRQRAPDLGNSLTESRSSGLDRVGKRGSSIRRLLPDRRHAPQRIGRNVSHRGSPPRRRRDGSEANDVLAGLASPAHDNRD